MFLFVLGKLVVLTTNILATTKLVKIIIDEHYKRKNAKDLE